MSTWEGIYESFAEIPMEDKGHHFTTGWRDAEKGRIKKLQRAIRHGGAISPAATHDATLLSFLASTAIRWKDSAVILDCGGGAGRTFLAVVNTLELPLVEYHIFETELIAQLGSEMIKDDSVTFHASLPKLDRVDIAYMRGFLHYVDDWKGFLSDVVAACNPDYLFFAVLTAGDIPTFATLYNYREAGRVPQWYLNAKEFIDAVCALGYGCLLKSKDVNIFRGEAAPLPMENFPPEYRLETTCSILFRKARRDA